MIGGYIKETNAMARERAKQQREDELLNEEFQRNIDLAKEQSKIELDTQKGIIDYRIQKETDQAVATWARQASQRETESFFTAFIFTLVYPLLLVSPLMALYFNPRFESFPAVFVTAHVLFDLGVDDHVTLK